MLSITFKPGNGKKPHTISNIKTADEKISELYPIFYKVSFEC